MNTLPVEPWKLYVSKFLTAFVLFILDLIIAVLTFSIMNHGFAWIKDIIGSMSALLPATGQMEAKMLTLCLLSSYFM